jgi:hypothetical protein
VTLSRFKRICGLVLFELICVAHLAAADLNFRTDVLPILTKAGCNAGACHGAATGQGGFHLSLLGYDPEADYWSITREFSGRRVDLDFPAESLFLKKPTRQLEHEGGRRIARNSDHHQHLINWLKAGAPYGDESLSVARIEVQPTEQLLSTNERVQLKVKAVLSNGAEQDVSTLALYSSNDDAIAEVKPFGEVKTTGRGVTSVMVRYSGQVAAARIVVPFSNAKPEPFRTNNFIDEHIGQELARLGIPPSPLSSDTEFLRRVYLDLTGRLPEPETAKAIGEQHQLVRTELISKLLESDAFVDYWTMKLADLLLISGKRGSEKATLAYHNWLKSQIAERKSWKEIASAILTATGDTSEVGPANFFTLANDPRDLAEYAGNMFLGVQIGCARCHAHPSDRWTQDDYYKFSANFAAIKRDGSRITANPRAELPLPKTRKPASPSPLGAIYANSIASADMRVQLAHWMTHPENPFFAPAFVNRVWKELLGRGLFEPVDDLRPTNPAVIPSLLSDLSKEFVAHDYDLRWLLRTIASSRTYQLTSRANAINAGDDRFYSHAYLKALPASVLVDAIAQATGVSDQFESYPDGTRAVQLIGTQTPSYALDVLGRCNRERACEPSASGGGLAQALHLMNGATINAKVRAGVLDELWQKKTPVSQIVEHLYFRAFARPPSSEELGYWAKTIRNAEQPHQALQDFFWALLNSREFAYNH